MYLADRRNLGRLGADGSTYPQIFQPVAYGGIFSAALWESARGLLIYVVEAGDFTRAYRNVAGWFESAPFAETWINEDYAYQGMAVSAYGSFAESGILWMSTGDHNLRGLIPGTLHAFDALNLTELWNSEMNSDRDQLGAFTKFVAPTVANGRVYVPTLSNQLVIYGLLDATEPVSTTVNRPETGRSPRSPGR